MASVNTTETYQLPDLSTDPRVIEALGEGNELTDDQRRLLSILLDPHLDPYDTTTFEELLEQWSLFEGHVNDIPGLAYRMELFRTRTDGRESWVFQFINDQDSGWFEVGSYVPNTLLHVTMGEDGKYLSGQRYGLTGLRAAVHAADTIEYTWRCAREQMVEHGLIHSTDQHAERKGYVVSWEIDDAYDSTSPEQAAAYVWKRIFKRDRADADDACVFRVTDQSTDAVTHVDLSECDYDELIKE